MAGTIVADIIQSDQSYASRINIASPMVVSNTVSFNNTLTLGSSATISGNVNIDSGTFFVDSVNNRVGIGTQNPGTSMTLDVRGNMRLGDGVSSEQDIVFQALNSGSGWQLGANDGSMAGGQQFYLYKGETSNGYVWQVDGSGRVTMRGQPRYFYSGGTTLGSSWTTVIPTSAIISSSDYSTSTGRFTAPITGTYYFAVWGLFYPADSTDTWTAAFTKNGSTYGHGIQGGGNSTSHASYSGSVIMELSAGDWCDFRVNTGNNGLNAYGSQWNQFGYLMF